MSKLNLVPKISLVIFFAIIAYALLVMTMARPAPVEGFGERTDWEMAVVTLALPISLFVTVAIGLWRALKSKDYLWLVLQLVFMPSAYLYTLVINTGVSSSLKSNPHRGPA